MDATFAVLVLSWIILLAVVLLRSLLNAPPAFPSGLRPKKLVLDLDETLVHSTLKHSNYTHHSLNLLVEGSWRQFHVIKRPHLHFFLKQAAKRYEVVLFTAGLREYADPLINLLDQNRDIFSSRYFRESCVNRGGYFVKDLTKIDVDLRNGFLVDNSEISYSLQKENGVPIPHFFDDPSDEALLNLMCFLDALLVAADVRSIISIRLM
eukprot:TRINITY_DN2427_c0_g1_i2.p1 TRINITY_DN2427_c0_g1~~TRINITY_DN2427_c0_g1_i2.p1  ORF type:complete len:222 (-),score=21.69 TRINITY_DN2427_c0_g1_i2:114-737(-)